MFKVTKYPHGTFSWADCASTDSEKAKKFYMDLMGWNNEDIPMGEGLFYTMMKQDGETVAAVSPMQKDMQEMGVPTVWNNYITVDDVDALQAKVTELGGKVLAPPFDVFDS
jgi:predicted enzyme related to lactoylglutathione lyase